MFKEFKIGELFSGETGDTDIKKEHINHRGYPVVSSGVDNMGVIGKTDINARVMPADTITVDMFGNAFFRDFEYKIVTHARVFALIPKGFRLSTETGLYVTSLLSYLSKIFSYNNMCSYKKTKDKFISLPVIESPDPDHEYTINDLDFDYMRERIAELEEERIAELDAYLIASGLDDYELTDENREVLSLSPTTASDEIDASEDYRGDGQVAFRNFKIGDLFEVRNNPQLDKENFIFSESANYPYFTRTERNNGILGYVEYLDEEHKIKGNSLAVGMISMKFHYMHHDFYAGQFTKTLLPKFQEFNEKLAMYFIAILNRHSEYYQSYLVRHFADKVRQTIVSLPVVVSSVPDYEYTIDDIDFDYMERYIHAVEKLTIADVIKYRNKVITTTKQVVGVS